MCTRHGMLEKHMPDLISITDEQFESFITRAINTSYGRDTLAKITKQAEATATQNPTDYAEAAEDGVSANPQKPARGRLRLPLASRQGRTYVPQQVALSTT